MILSYSTNRVIEMFWTRTERTKKKKNGLKYRPRTRRKDVAEIDICTVNRNVSVELTFDGEDGEDMLVVAQVLRRQLS